MFGIILENAVLWCFGFYWFVAFRLFWVSLDFAGYVDFGCFADFVAFCGLFGFGFDFVLVLYANFAISDVLLGFAFVVF